MTALWLLGDFACCVLGGDNPFDHLPFVDIPETVMQDALVGFGLPEWQAAGLIEDYAHYRRGEAADV
jgi:hypothetical protein